MIEAAAIRDRLDALAAAMPGVGRDDADGRTTWSAEGREFAALDRHGLELRLDRAVAAAAARTPDTTPSERGAEWIRFSPAGLDGHAVDRLEAWFGLAYRRAGEPPSRSRPN